ncbi:hypothetical protein QBC47DRAFT_185136 [Echria macrotheca]|uniref:Uncharacterized protein n=1 Tax=Echria macrotheca TaxID=438768 RepID=A0AAJ0BGG3_9PEZI|nr:hypothetical protein QBC47DRAFT_185136 [Echria macrotheca]
MLVRDIKRLALLLGPLVVLLLLSYSFWNSDTDWEVSSHISTFLTSQQPPAQDGAAPPSPPAPAIPKPGQEQLPSTGDSSAKTPSHGSMTHGHGGTNVDLPKGDTGDGTHIELFSLSTADKKYFSIKFGNLTAFNPNIIPHPTLNDTYIIVGQKTSEGDPQMVFFEIGCNATFVDGTLQCTEETPNFLPVAATKADQDRCEGHLEVLNMNIGPHDARVLYGPTKPYLMFGSNSQFTCFGMWLQDFPSLVADWETKEVNETDFVTATELQRPQPYGALEKNWFIFWDKDNVAYAHYVSTPSRVFAKLWPNGSVGPNLGPYAAEQDEKCVAAYLPKLPDEHESIHQATNSLRVTMCKRADKTCVADEKNTFIISIIQHKKYYDFHGEYEPYVMVFRERSPFEIYAISKKPLWISGRKRLDGNKTEMLYVASMNWKARGLNYHGYLDDELFLSFGIEDKSSGGIDVLASDLLTGLGLCSDA